MNEVYTQWKKLWFDNDGLIKESKSNISIMKEWEVIQKRFLKAGDNTNFHIKEQPRKIAYQDTTTLKQPT